MAAHEKRFESWVEFKDFVADLRKNYRGDFFFRGHEDARWALTTTLERSPAAPMSLKHYYRLVHSIRSEIESATNTAWGIPGYGEIVKQLSDFKPLSVELMGRGVPALEYIGYLRHDGFPSPLLDWTRSPYAAAFFAFRGRGDVDRAIFVFLKSSESHWSPDEPSISDLAWRVGGHRRHFLQRSAYTICLQYHTNRHEWDFASHEQIFARTGDANQSTAVQDLFWKVTLPGKLRVDILRELDEHNLNAFSLFTSDESLMETLAVREMEFGIKP